MFMAIFLLLGFTSHLELQAQKVDRAVLLNLLDQAQRKMIADRSERTWCWSRESRTELDRRIITDPTESVRLDLGPDRLRFQIERANGTELVGAQLPEGTWIARRTRDRPDWSRWHRDSESPPWPEWNDHLSHWLAPMASGFSSQGKTLVEFLSDSDVKIIEVIAGDREKEIIANRRFPNWKHPAKYHFTLTEMAGVWVLTREESHFFSGRNRTSYDFVEVEGCIFPTRIHSHYESAFDPESFTEAEIRFDAPQHLAMDSTLELPQTYGMAPLSVQREPGKWVRWVRTPWFIGNAIGIVWILVWAGYRTRSRGEGFGSLLAQALVVLILFQIAGGLAGHLYSRREGAILGLFFWLPFCLAAEGAPSLMVRLIGGYLGGLVFFRAEAMWAEWPFAMGFFLALVWPMAAAAFARLRQRGWPAVAALPVAWVAMEGIAHTLLLILIGSGAESAAVQLASSLSPNSAVAPLAAIGGMWLVVAFWAALVGSVSDFVRFRNQPRRSVRLAAWITVALGLPWIIIEATSSTARSAEPIDVVVVPNRSVEFDREHRYLPHSRDPELPTDADLMVFSFPSLLMEWIEGLEDAVEIPPSPNVLFGEGEVRRRMEALAKATHAAISIGYFRRGPSGSLADRFQGMLWVDREATMFEYRDKRCLIPFRETPLTIMGIGELGRQTDGYYFHAGRPQPTMDWTRKSACAIRVIPAIGSEVFCPKYLRAAWQQGDRRRPTILVNSAFAHNFDPRAKELLAEQALWRAIELGVPVVQSTCDGISLMADQSGKIVASLASDSIVDQRYVRATLRLVPGPATPYSRLGDWPLWIALLLLLAGAWSRGQASRQAAITPARSDAAAN